MSDIYHATFDTSFRPRLRHVPASELIPEYFALQLNPERSINLSRAQLAELYDAIRDGFVSEIPYIRPIGPPIGARVVIPSPETEGGRR